MNFNSPGAPMATTTELAGPLSPGVTVLSGRFILRELLELGDMVRGTAAVWLADSVGASFVLKVWSRHPSDDIAIRTIWNHEVRSLLRLDGLPKAHDHFASLEAIGADDHGYHVVIDGGGRQLLSEALAARERHDWLRRIDQPRVRAKLWEGTSSIGGRSGDVARPRHPSPRSRARVRLHGRIRGAGLPAQRVRAVAPAQRGGARRELRDWPEQDARTGAWPRQRHLLGCLRLVRLRSPRGRVSSPT